MNNRQTDRQTETHTYRHKERRERKTDTQTADRETDTQTADRETDTQTDRHRQTHTHTEREKKREKHSITSREYSKIWNTIPKAFRQISDLFKTSKHCSINTSKRNKIQRTPPSLDSRLRTKEFCGMYSNLGV